MVLCASGTCCCMCLHVYVGVTRFVCLMEQEERKLRKFVAYEDVAQEIAAEYGKEIHFEVFPMPGLVCAKCFCAGIHPFN